MLWKVTVAVTQTVQMEYQVEADTREEAAALAERGETVEETFIRDLAVTDRNILDGPVEV